MVISSGLLILQGKKILLIHPTNAPWYNSFSIPKGKVEKGETLLEAAIRETIEEVGVYIDKNDILNTDEPNVVEYHNKDGVVYKKVYYYIVKPSQYITLNDKKNNLRETDWVGFLDINEAEMRIFWRFSEMLQYII